MQIFVDVLGWVGAALFLIAYALVSLKKVEGDALHFSGYQYRGRYFPDHEHRLLEGLSFRCVELCLDWNCDLYTWA